MHFVVFLAKVDMMTTKVLLQNGFQRIAVTHFCGGVLTDSIAAVLMAVGSCKTCRACVLRKKIVKKYKFALAYVHNVCYNI